MAESRRLSVLPPDGDDDERLRRALGQAAAETPGPSPTSPVPARVPAAKVTVSVRMSPDTQARLVPAPSLQPISMVVAFAMTRPPCFVLMPFGRLIPCPFDGVP
ncbi:MAG: hypothetical protein HQL41_14670 [Alphaproteobacteria bacterium]|nr:hypothetical protein [Alphaproteobacteria bacterium]